MSNKTWYNPTKEQSRNMLVFGYNRENYYYIIPADVSIVIASFYKALPMWDFCEEMHLFKQQTKTWFPELFYKMGTFNALTNYSTKDKSNYSRMLKRIKSQIKIGNNHIQSIKDLVDDINDTNNIKLSELENHSTSLVSIFDKISSELREAETYIHPDHKKIQLLQMQIKELQLSEPHIDSISLSALSLIPLFIKCELDKFHAKRMTKIRTKEQEKELDEKNAKQRVSNFNDSFSKVMLLSKNIKDEKDFIKTKLKTIQNAETDATTVMTMNMQQINIACDQINEYTESVEDEIYAAQHYIHPSQAALVQLAANCVKLETECEESKKLLTIKNGELEAYKLKDELKKQYKQSESHELPSLQFEKMNGIFNELRNESSLASDSISMDEWKNVRKLIDDMEEQLHLVNNSVNPTASYVCRLEQRYIEMCGLYKMKFSEVEDQKDLLYQFQQEVRDLNEQIVDLEYKLGAVMSSAASNVATRMKVFNEKGIKIQTFQKVTTLVGATYANIQQACQDIQECVEKDLYEIIGDSFDEKQHQDTTGMIGDVAYACDYILYAFDVVGQEMVGIEQFVHPDREMCETLQLELIAMYEKQEKEQLENNNDTEYEQYGVISENYNIKGKQHTEICCSTDGEKNKNNSYEATGHSNEYFESSSDKRGDHKPVKIIQNNNIVDLNVYISTKMISKTINNQL